MARVGYGPMDISVPRYKIVSQAPNRPCLERGYSRERRKWINNNSAIKSWASKRAGDKRSRK
jgi:hypothetical protein